MSIDAGICNHTFSVVDAEGVFHCVHCKSVRPKPADEKPTYDRGGLPPRLIASLSSFDDVFGKRVWVAGIQDRFNDVVFMTTTGIPDDGTDRNRDIAARTAEYRIAAILVEMWNNQRTRPAFDQPAKL